MEALEMAQRRFTGMLPGLGLSSRRVWIDLSFFSGMLEVEGRCDRSI